MGDPWGIGGFRGGGRIPILKKWSKNRRNRKKKNRKKNRKNQIFFTENGLKCIRNPTKHLLKSTCQKKKLGEIGEKIGKI